MPPPQDPGPPLALVVPRYQYPEALAEAGVEGYALVGYTVDSNGRILDPYVLRSRVFGSKKVVEHQRLMETHAKYVVRHSHFERKSTTFPYRAFEDVVLFKFVMRPG